MKNIGKLIIVIIICELVGIAGSIFTVPAISNWYLTLNKPSFSPPNWIFGPVWTLLYLLMGVSVYLIWNKGLKNRKIREALVIFSAQLFLNFLWSFLFFGLRSPILGLINIVALWLVILLTIVKFHQFSKPAAYLLFPYLLWVSFASLLNFSILLMN